VVEDFSGHRVDEVAFGGGAARSECWAAILADVLDRPVATLRHPDQANARAVALLALHRAGVLSEADLAARAETAEPIRPEPATRAVHERMQTAFEASFDALRPIFRDLNP
jgi:xylulokinase